VLIGVDKALIVDNTVVPENCFVLGMALSRQRRSWWSVGKKLVANQHRTLYLVLALGTGTTRCQMETKRM
jgi:hypothetical protein